jgi:hypothetical protein
MPNREIRTLRGSRRARPLSFAPIVALAILAVGIAYAQQNLPMPAKPPAAEPAPGRTGVPPDDASAVDAGPADAGPAGGEAGLQAASASSAASAAVRSPHVVPANRFIASPACPEAAPVSEMRKLRTTPL